MVSIVWKYEIGDYVAHEAVRNQMVLILRHTDLSVRLDRLKVEEQMAIENRHGISLFYACRTPYGAVEKHPEEHLINGNELVDVWVTETAAQGKRLKNNASQS